MECNPINCDTPLVDDKQMITKAGHLLRHYADNETKTLYEHPLIGRYCSVGKGGIPAIIQAVTIDVKTNKVIVAQVEFRFSERQPYMIIPATRLSPISEKAERRLIMALSEVHNRKSPLELLAIGFNLCADKDELDYYIEGKLKA